MKTNYLQRRVYQEWLNILEEVENKIEKTIHELSIRYNEVGKFNFNYTNLINNKEKYIFPKFYNILKPFRKIKPNDVKVILLGDHPYSDGSATGIPFEKGSKLFTQSAAIDQELSVIADCLFKSNLKINKVIDIDSWYSQGVLTLYCSLTVCSLDGESHFDLWNKIIKHIITKLYNLNNNIIIVPFGKESKSLINSTLISNQAVIIDSVAPIKFPLKTYNTFINSNVFKQINYFLKKPINW